MPVPNQPSWQLKDISQIKEIGIQKIIEFEKFEFAIKYLFSLEKWPANNPVLTVEGGGLGVVDADQVKAKLRFDPKGLLNPGTLEGWEVKEQFKI